MHIILLFVKTPNAGNNKDHESNTTVGTYYISVFFLFTRIKECLYITTVDDGQTGLLITTNSMHKFGGTDSQGKTILLQIITKEISF